MWYPYTFLLNIFVQLGLSKSWVCLYHSVLYISKHHGSTFVKVDTTTCVNIFYLLDSVKSMPISHKLRLVLYSLQTFLLSPKRWPITKFLLLTLHFIKNTNVYFTSFYNIVKSQNVFKQPFWIGRSGNINATLATLCI